MSAPERDDVPTLVPPPRVRIWRRGRNRDHQPVHGEVPSPPAGRRRRWLRWSAYGLTVVLALALVSAVVPIPFLNGLLGSYISGQVAAQVACPGTAAKPPSVTVKGALLPQLLSQRLTELDLTLPDLTAGGAKHVVFTATLRDVSQPKPNTTHVGRMDAAITIGFANMPPPPAGTPVPTYGRAPDGALMVTATVSPDAAKDVKAKLYLKMDLSGNTLTSTPQRMRIFGHTLPASQITAMTGGPRTQKLPALPAGWAYHSISPQADGMHVALSGVTTTPLNKLPTNMGGRTVSYVARDGLLGITTSAVNIPPIINVPLTLFVQPQLGNGTLTMVPRSVEIFGANRPSTDPIAKLIFSQIKQQDLSRKLPALPAGLKYQSVAVDGTGLKVGVGGVTVQPYSQFPQPPGGPHTTYGAEDGLLTATTMGAGGRTMPVVVYAKPTIEGDKMSVAPQQIAMFGTLFPAADVFAEVKSQPTTYPLQALPGNLHYQSVEVVQNGLRIHLAGTDVTLGKGLLGGQC